MRNRAAALCAVIRTATAVEAEIGSKTLTISKASVCECILQRESICGNVQTVGMIEQVGVFSDPSTQGIMPLSRKVVHGY